LFFFDIIGPDALSAAAAGETPMSEEPSNQETELGLARRFNTTHWSVVLAAGDETSPKAEEALARLCQTYWFPIYAFVRKRGHSPEQAKDLTQAFFANFLEKQHVTKANRERGRFRSFLMTSMENFLRNENDRAQAQKRGGGRGLLSLDEQDAEARYLREPTTEMDPAKAFEQRWAATLLLTVLNRLQVEFGATGRGDLFEALQAHFWGDSESTPYPELAERFGLSLTNVKAIAHRLRQRYRELLREEIAHTVALPSQVDDEIRHLMQVVSG
jgi:RNA polymerase sigma-70 factor (ECF subfamily)